MSIGHIGLVLGAHAAADPPGARGRRSNRGSAGVPGER